MDRQEKKNHRNIESCKCKLVFGHNRNGKTNEANEANEVEEEEE